MKAYFVLGATLMAGVLLGLAAQQAWTYCRTPHAEAERKLELSVTDNAHCKIARVVDGDTVVLENGMHVRYRGINAPETGYFLHDPAPFGMEATTRNKELAEGKIARISLGDPPLDAYGRVIARLYVLDEKTKQETDVENLLLKEGLAKLLPLGQPSADADALRDSETEAREKKRGLWSTPPDEAATRVAFPYCCASGSRVFHKTGCNVARNISTAQFKGFTNLDEAVLTGRHLCSQCIKAQVKKSGGLAPALPDEPGPENEEPTPAAP